MKRSWGWVGLMALVLCISVSWMTGCAKKAVAQAPVAVTSPPDSRVARDRALQDQALSDQAAREAAAKAAKDAADRVKREATAILKELQIADINFDYNMYNLKPEAQEILKKGAPAYLKYRDYKLVVEGHCDERGTAEYNLALGEKERIKTISYGKEMPLDKGNDEAAWAKNRRAHFVIFPPVK
jgi:peptidoglycan-associated lipoprotein